MNQQNQKPKSPNSGPEMRQLIFLAVILAALLVLVLGGFAVVQVVDQLVNQSHTPPITEQPGNNPIETVPDEQQKDPEEDPSWWDSLWAGIVDLFKPVDTTPSTPAGKDPEATYPFASNASSGSVIPQGNGTVIDGSKTYSEYSIVVDMRSGQVLASERADERMYPASMTKVMTLLVAVEHLPHESSLQDKITVSKEIVDRMASLDSSGFGMAAGDQLTVEDMLYAILLESDGIACSEMAIYIAGSEQAFVELMNQKAADLGLTNTHFANPTGLHDANHYSTCREIAAIMSYAATNELCAKIMSTKEYNALFYWPEGDKMVTYYFKHSYLNKYGNSQPTSVTITAAKTGWTDEAKFCLVSYAEGKDGAGYICVTGFASSPSCYVEDHVSLYNKYAK